MHVVVCARGVLEHAVFILPGVDVSASCGRHAEGVFALHVTRCDARQAKHAAVVEAGEHDDDENDDECTDEHQDER